MDFIDKIVELGFELHTKNIPAHIHLEHALHQKVPQELKPETLTTPVAHATREHKPSRRHKQPKDVAHTAPQEKSEEPMGDDPATEEARKFTLKIF
jgi:hypothetical protein